MALPLEARDEIEEARRRYFERPLPRQRVVAADPLDMAAQEGEVDVQVVDAAHRVQDVLEGVEVALERGAAGGGV